MKYSELCNQMVAAGWVSHAMVGSQFRARRLDSALRATRTYKEFKEGRRPPKFRKAGSHSARLVYSDGEGQQSDAVLVNPRQHVFLHIHSATGRSTIGYLEDVDPAAIVANRLSVAPEIIADDHPEEVDQAETLSEGATKKVRVNRYERNVEARRRCIEHHGFKCCACGFDFKAFYGDPGAGFIHVHHIIPLSEVRPGYRVNPVEDLRPVCPNCHAMLHVRKGMLTVETLQVLIFEQNCKRDDL